MKMKIFIIAAIVIVTIGCVASADPIYDLSRKNSVRIYFNNNEPVGSGFFLDRNHVVTCFHVAAKVTVDIKSSQVQWAPRDNIQIEMENGKKVSATLVSVPTQQDPTPYVHDFAILRLTSSQSQEGFNLYSGIALPEVGSDVLFSGYPLGAPTMLTHNGRISGIDKDERLICIQAPINKGNSGGGLLTSKGELLGIISMREGGITKKLDDTRTRYEQRKNKMASVRIGGLDPVDISIDTIKVLDAYISTGIGYAINIKYLKEYLVRHPL